MDRVEELYGFASFVRLQVSDQVPFGGVASDLSDLSLGLLDLILTKNVDPGDDRFAQNSRRLRLANRDKLYLIRVTARRRGRTLGPFPDRLKISI
jgi:hypothetical protein